MKDKLILLVILFLLVQISSVYSQNGIEGQHSIENNVCISENQQVQLIQRLGSSIKDLNIVRIVSLFIIGKYSNPIFFEFMHVDFWQVIFIVITILFWSLWIKSTSVDAIKLPLHS